GMLNVANARFAYCFGTCEFYSSFVYWSLSLEEQFYLLLPLLIFFVRGRWLPVLLGAWVLFQLVQARGLWLMAFRTDALLLGVL
ncbi:acyltransferase, partial [Pseudomonas sp. ATCC 13867]